MALGVSSLISGLAGPVSNIISKFITKKEVQMLVQLREFARQAFEDVPGKHNPLSQMLARDAAWALSSIVKSLDDVLKGHVEFGE